MFDTTNMASNSSKGKLGDGLKGQSLSSTYFQEVAMSSNRACLYPAVKTLLRGKTFVSRLPFPHNRR